ncbi:hypothetical protein BHM03_00009454 [Ensete ventricosum]|nr:hypothetical protein BHM03_00009454 [Ensete ventricosum]
MMALLPEGITELMQHSKLPVPLLSTDEYDLFSDYFYLKCRMPTEVQGWASRNNICRKGKCFKAPSRFTYATIQLTHLWHFLSFMWILILLIPIIRIYFRTRQELKWLLRNCLIVFRQELSLEWTVADGLCRKNAFTIKPRVVVERDVPEILVGTENSLLFKALSAQLHMHLKKHIPAVPLVKDQLNCC